MGLKKIRINTESDLREIKGAFNDEGWIFRGHSNCNWHLIPSIERYYDAYVPLKNNIKIPLNEIEKNIFYCYDSLTHCENKNIRYSYDKIKRMIDLQLHGCATRLLDITRDFNTACFFAFSDSSLSSCEYSCIWCFKTEFLKNHILSSNNQMIYEDFEKWEITTNKADCFFDPLHKKTGIILVGNLIEKQQERQKGIFLMNVSYRTNFMDGIYKLFSIKPSDVGSVETIENFTSLKIYEYLSENIIQLVVKKDDFLKDCEKSILTDKSKNVESIFIKGIVPEIVALNKFVKGFET